MEYMFALGFLGTKAPFFMDFVVLIVAFLPILIWLGVLLAKKRLYALHAFYQITIFIVSLIVVGWFEYGVRAGGGFQSFTEHNPRSITIMTIVLIVHIIIAIVTTVYWAKTIWQAYNHYKKGHLPGKFSLKHIGRAKLAMIGIFATSLTGTLVYLMLFVY